MGVDRVLSILGIIAFPSLILVRYMKYADGAESFGSFLGSAVVFSVLTVVCVLIASGAFRKGRYRG